jgi:hypothetical protein
MLDALFADFRNVDQSFQIFFEPGKCTELGQAGDRSFNQLSLLVVLTRSIQGSS